MATSHGHLIKIQALSNQLIFMTVVASLGHMIVTWDLPSQLPMTKFNREKPGLLKNWAQKAIQLGNDSFSNHLA